MWCDLNGKLKILTLLTVKLINILETINLWDVSGMYIHEI